jgi:hypothetical protein
MVPDIWGWQNSCNYLANVTFRSGQVSLRGAEAATLSEVEGVAGGDEAISVKPG